MKNQTKVDDVHKREVTHGGDNVFADLGFSKTEAADLEVKAGLTLQIHQRIKHLKLTQTKAAKLLGVSQPDVSKLMAGRHTGYSIDRLLALLNALEVDVDIVVRPRHHRQTANRGVVRVVEVTAA